MPEILSDGLSTFLERASSSYYFDTAKAKE